MRMEWPCPECKWSTKEACRATIVVWTEIVQHARQSPREPQWQRGIKPKLPWHQVPREKYGSRRPKEHSNWWDRFVKYHSIRAWEMLHKRPRHILGYFTRFTPQRKKSSGLHTGSRLVQVSDNHRQHRFNVCFQCRNGSTGDDLCNKRGGPSYVRWWPSEFAHQRYANDGHIHCVNKDICRV